MKTGPLISPISLISLILLIGGCAPPYPPGSPERCTALTEARTILGASAKGAGALAGAAAGSTALVKTDDGKLALAVSGAVLGAAAVTLGFAESSDADTLLRECRK